MRSRMWMLGLLVLVSWGCQAVDQARLPSPADTPTVTPSAVPSMGTPTVSPTRTSPVPSTPTPVPPRPTPTPAASSQRPLPFPNGFETGADWLLVFRPAVHRGTWMDGEMWLSNGQRWIGPWPSDIFIPFWTLLDKTLAFCYYQPDATPDIPTCATVPPHLKLQPSLQPSRMLSGELPPKPGDPWVPCGEEGALCLRGGDQTLSASFRLPLPEFLFQRIRSEEGSEEEAPEPLDVNACVTNDRRHAVFAIRRVGGYSEMQAGPESPLIFPGALYWVDLQSGQVMTAPTNAPTWPAEQETARLLVRQGALPASFLSFWERALSEPTVEGLIGCSPSGEFALVLKMTEQPGKDVYFPSDVERVFETSKLIPPKISFVLMAWVIRLRDGSGYPLTLFHELFTQGHTVQWVQYRTLEPSTLSKPSYLPPTHPLPWWGNP